MTRISSKLLIHYEIDVAVFSLEVAHRNLFDLDPQAQYAMTLFGDVDQLMNLGGQSSVVAAR